MKEFALDDNWKPNLILMILFSKYPLKLEHGTLFVLPNGSSTK